MSQLRISAENSFFKKKKYPADLLHEAFCSEVKVMYIFSAKSRLLYGSNVRFW